MNDVVTIGPHTLYLGDCRDILPTLGKFDLCLTDPPYGIGRGQGMGKGGGGFVKNRNDYLRRYELGDWDKSRPKKEIFDFILEQGQECAIWGGNYFTDYLPVSGKWLFWDKVQTMPSYSDGEMCWTSFGGDAVKQFTYNGSGLHAKEKNRVHPTQKPVALMAWCLGFAPKAKTVIDPFMGSGTTGVACAQLGRIFAGIERERKYFDIACERIAAAEAQGRIFEEVETKPEQEQLWQ